jgi:hypothetical protein
MLASSGQIKKLLLVWIQFDDPFNSSKLSFDDNSNWFVHPFPEKKWIVLFLILWMRSKVVYLPKI